MLVLMRVSIIEMIIKDMLILFNKLEIIILLFFKMLELKELLRILLLLLINLLKVHINPLLLHQWLVTVMVITSMLSKCDDT